MSNFSRLFSLSRAVALGMVHVRALPGTPLNSMPMKSIINKACDEASVLMKHGVDGIILENMHDLPYTLNPGPEVVASMAVICSEVRLVCNALPVGIQILACGNKEALAVAHSAGLDFIRAEGFVFAHVADEGVVQGCAGELLRYRRWLGADNISILTDVKKKHSSHSLTADMSLAETARAAEFFLSDGLIVTGTETGTPADPGQLAQVKSATRLPVLIGSGVTKTNLDQYLNANGFIIGSHFKQNGHWKNKLDENRVREFMSEFKRKTADS